MSAGADTSNGQLETLGRVQELQLLVHQQQLEIERLRFQLGETPTMLVSGPGQLPSQAHWGDAGLDLYVYGQDWVIEPGEFVDVDCGISVQFPAGYWGRIVGRSSTLRNRGLLCAEGTIDSSYTGRIFSGVWNLTSAPVTVRAGERLAQLILQRDETTGVSIVRRDQLSSRGRGTAGFGSSGK